MAQLLKDKKQITNITSVLITLQRETLSYTQLALSVKNTAQKLHKDWAEIPRFLTEICVQNSIYVFTASKVTNLCNVHMIFTETEINL